MSEVENGGRRFLALAAVQTLLVGLLAGVLARINPFALGHDSFARFDPVASDFAAVLAIQAVEAVLALAVVLYLSQWFVLLVLENADPAERRRAPLVVGAACLGIPLAGVLVLLAPGISPAVTVARLLTSGLFSLMTVGGLAVLVAAFRGLSAISALCAGIRESFPVEAASLGTGFSILLIAGLAVGTPVGAAVGDVTFLVGDGYNPSVRGTFVYDYERAGDGRAVLTIRHDGGPAIPADELYIEGDSIVAVDGANQTEAGRWQGSTVPGANGPTVDAGNAVAVGVTGDCDVRVVRRDETAAAILGTVDCPG